MKVFISIGFDSNRWRAAFHRICVFETPETVNKLHSSMFSSEAVKFQITFYDIHVIDIAIECIKLSSHLIPHFLSIESTRASAGLEFDSGLQVRQAFLSFVQFCNLMRRCYACPSSCERSALSRRVPREAFRTRNDKIPEPSVMCKNRTLPVLPF